MTKRRILAFGLAGGTLLSCGGPQSTTQPAATVAPEGPAPAEASPEPSPASGSPSFDDDVSYLRDHGDVQLLRAPSGAVVAVSAKYQGRVMTSAVASDAPSLGFVDRRFIDAGETGTQFDNYGGEDRFWLGPEGGQFGLYFPAGKPFTFDNWQTPAAFQEGAWDVAERSDASIRFRRAMQVRNYTGTTFDLAVERTVELIPEQDVAGHLRAPIPHGVRYVAYQSVNEVQNTGDKAWTPDGGLISIWILAMYTPSPDMVVIVPFLRDAEGPVVNDAYFGKVPADRLIVDDQKGVALFRCDGKHRSKIGLPPERAASVVGSYSPSARLLTIVTYNGPVPGARYVNSMWEHQDEPFAGDVVNSYNDGPTEPGKPSLGGFYEIETSSPGLELEPGARFQHAHRTFHLVGNEELLETFARIHFGVSLSWVRERMPPR